MNREELREKVARAIHAADLQHPHDPYNYRAFADAAIALVLVLEEAARECEAQRGFNEYHHQCAAAIRSLGEKE